MSIHELSVAGVDRLMRFIFKMNMYVFFSERRLCKVFLKKYPEISTDPIVMEILSRIYGPWNDIKIE